MSEKDRVSYRKGPASKQELPSHVFPKAADHVVFSTASFLATRGKHRNWLCATHEGKSPAGSKRFVEIEL